jgi:subtilisin-like proprotein convertase family protein
MVTRILLILLASLLALPLVPTASPVEAKKRSRTVTRTYSNPAAITIPIDNSSPVSASVYPSTIAVDGLKGTIRDVNLVLNNLQHTDPDDVQVLLVGPRGQTAIVLADVGGGVGVDDVTLRLDDEATESLPNLGTLQSGAFRPTSIVFGSIAFNAPAPTTSANTALSVFDGTNPNGTWRLFVQDDYGLYDPGAIGGGWDLEITTTITAKKKRGGRR